MQKRYRLWDLIGHCEDFGFTWGETGIRGRVLSSTVTCYDLRLKRSSWLLRTLGYLLHQSRWEMICQTMVGTVGRERGCQLLHLFLETTGFPDRHSGVVKERKEPVDSSVLA